MGNHFTFYILLFSLFSSLTGHGQYLPVNEKGKCELAEVVLADGFSKGTLFSNGLSWVKGLTKTEGKLTNVVKDSIGGSISGNYEFIVYAQSGILRKTNGAISYHFSLETKDGKYRYSFTQFEYHYYKQDRNYKMVRTGRIKPLEEIDASGWQKLWTDHRRTVFVLVTNQVAELKTKIVEVPNTANNKNPEKKVDW